MSCSLVKHCALSNLKSLKQILFPEEQSEQELLRDDDWENRWNWDTSEQPISLQNKQESVANWWLSVCQVAVSPFGNLIAFARNVHIAVYKNENNSLEKSDQTDEAVLLWSTTLSGLESKERITSLLWIPLVSQQKSAGGSPDWTCLVIGFSSGCIRFYNETGGLLLAQVLHDQPVINIKCQTFSMGDDKERDQMDEVLVVYESAVVLIDGFVLYQSLRSCRNQLARTKGSSRSFGFDFATTAVETNIPFVYKKFHLQSAEKISDCDNVGHFDQNRYDHLVSQSVKRGPHRGPKSNDPPANILVTTGDEPYVGFYRAQEGENQTILGEMAHAVMNKVKNFVPTSLFGFTKQEEAAKPKTEAAIPIPLRLGLFDQNRDGVKVNLAPNRRFGAVVDDFGRVVLFDISKMMAVRMWKGYRDAEIGWIEASEDKLSLSTGKKTMFLIIYAKKRGILEVWCCQSGPRVTAFSVGKSCKLLQYNYSMIGLNSLTLQQYKQYPGFFKSKCFLFDYTTSTLYNIQVPFLCALTDRNSKRTRDAHLLKELTEKLNERNKNDVIALVLGIKTSQARREALELVIKADDLQLIETVNAKMKTQLVDLYNKNELDHDSQLVIQMCARIEQLCKFYHWLCESLNHKTTIIDDSVEAPDIQDLMGKLGWEGPSIVRCLSLLVFQKTVKRNENVLTTAKKLNVVDFLSGFILHSNHLQKDKNGSVLTENITIEAKSRTESASLTHFVDLSNFIFLNCFLTQEVTIETSVKHSAILPSNLMVMLFTSWLSSNCYPYWKSWELFKRILIVIFDMLEASKELESEVQTFENSLLVWKDVIRQICGSSNLMASFIATQVLKSMNSSQMERDDEETKLSQVSGDLEWETIAIDSENLNFLVKQLEDVFLLELLLFSSENQVEITNATDISLRKIMSGGPGIVSELIAKWAIRNEIDPKILCERSEDVRMECSQASDAEEDQEMLTLGEEAIRTQESDTKTSSELLDHVRRCFPNCLEPDVLLANCAWESLVIWENEPSLSSFDMFNKSLCYLNLISSAVLKHNLACLIWKTFIQKRFETLATLMEKMGKVPKDRICKKELNMDDTCLEYFLDFAGQFLDFIIENNMMAEIEPLPIFTIDEWWRSRVNEANIKLPLVMVAIYQKVANAALVLEHSRLATAMLFIVTFQLKSVRPLSLLSHVVHQYLFKDFNAFPVHYSNSDPKLIDSRNNFLLKVVAAITGSLPIFGKNDDADAQELISQSKFYSQANKWFGKVIGLAREWTLNTDELRQQYVCELYKNGCDSLAEETFSSVVDLGYLGSKLLNTAGRRAVFLINEKYGTVEQMHTLPPSLLFWLKSLPHLDSNLYVGSPQSTLNMLEHINNFVHGEQTNRRMCELLIDAVKTLV